MGAKIFEQTQITRITYGENPAVHTDKGSIKANHVILCGNAYMGNLVPYLDARVLPATSCIIATEPLSDEQLQQTMVRDVAVCDSRTALDYYRLSADKRLLFGGLSNYSGLEPANAQGIMQAKMAKVFPSLKNTRIDYSWSEEWASVFGACRKLAVSKTATYSISAVTRVTGGTHAHDRAHPG